jgi:hypothetical protein
MDIIERYTQYYPSFTYAVQKHLGESDGDPLQLPTPRVLKPFRHSSRDLGPRVCDITCIIEVLPLTTTTMMNFFKGPLVLNEEFVTQEFDSTTSYKPELCCQIF